MSSSGSTIFSRSMNGITEISDGITEISDGSINCDELICNSLTTGSFAATSITATSISDGIATMVGGDLTGVNNLSCNSFIANTFGATNLGGSNLTLDNKIILKGNTAFNEFEMYADTTASKKYLTCQINQTGLSNGFKWIYGPTNVSCMILTADGNLRIGDDIRSLYDTNNIGLWNNHLGTIQLANSGDCAAMNILNAQVAGELHIAENASRTGKINIGCGTSAVNDINIGTGTSSGQTITVGKYAFYGNSLNYSIPSNSVNLFTNNTSTVSLGGPGGVKLGISGSRYVGMNTATNAAVIDMFSSGNSNYDTRIVSSGGTSTAGQGAMDLYANTISLNSTAAIGIGQSGPGTINIGNSTSATFMYGTKTSIAGSAFLAKNGNYGIEAKQYTSSGGSYFSGLEFHSSNTTSNYDVRIGAFGGNSTDGQGQVNIVAKTVVLQDSSANSSALYFGTSNLFRYVPWTTAYSGTTLATNIINYPTGTNCPTANAGAVIRYRYSIIGNSMYLHYHCYQTTGGGAGSGVYQYAIPSSYTINTTDLFMSSTTTPNGTKLGNSNLKQFGGTISIGGVYLTNQGGVYGLMLVSEVGGTYNSHGSSGTGSYAYSLGNLFVSFEAIIPIN